MKDVLRRKTSLKEEIEELLNKQVQREAKSSAVYLAMSAWCERHGFIHSANFFEVQSDEEREHMKKIFRYISSVGGTAVSPSVDEVQQEYSTLREVFDNALEQEISITHSINSIVDQCYKHKDYSTANFLNWFLEEQREEEALARRCLEIFEIVGEGGLNDLIIDKEMANVRSEAAPEA